MSLPDHRSRKRRRPGCVGVREFRKCPACLCEIEEVARLEAWLWLDAEDIQAINEPAAKMIRSSVSGGGVAVW